MLMKQARNTCFEAENSEHENIKHIASHIGHLTTTRSHPRNCERTDLFFDFCRFLRKMNKYDGRQNLAMGLKALQPFDWTRN